MDTILRTVAIYVTLLIIFRIAGKRSVAEITTFDFVLLLIISEATQQALVGDDYSFTNAVLVVVTLIGLDIGLSLLTEHSARIDRLVEGLPLIIVEDGHPIDERLKKSRIDISDILQAAREKQGLHRMDQIQLAILERSGGISIIPKSSAGGGRETSQA